jgi:hypothetical protein
MMTMRALKVLDYGAHRYQPGDLFEPDTANDARILALAQLAAEVEEETPPPRKPKKTAKHFYRRTDMRAEDSE